MKKGLLCCLVVFLAATSVVAACGGDTAADPAPGGDAGVAVADAGIPEDDPGSVDGGSGGPSLRTGLEGYCDRYKECGGTYYETAQDCIDASLRYWGECRRAELDAFDDCMIEVPCTDYNPNAYNPANTPCAEEWSVLREAAACD